MGRKIHPLGFRLGVNQKHYSHWFAQTKDYPKFLEGDRQIRTSVEKYIAKHVKDTTNYGGVGHIEIQRKTDLIRVDIHTGFPDLLIEEQSLGISQMKSDIENILGIESRKLRVILSSVTQPYGEPKILAEHVASQLRNRVPFRRTMKKAIELVGKTSDRGIKIQIAGRLNGSEMARVEWAREGRVPLQTIKAHVGYSYHPAQTIYGVLGIKTWTFRGTG
uniref:Small ribosomal subunit protein uS3c n=3 Tax=Cyrtomium TaxID=84613 RepID=A0A0S2GK62_9MONI|nr:ribosomal protein S3 [Cyrtomium devexiscapulae]YP_009192068.1 ribosomal protein S3 [Cyrtomium falcatum]YP_009479817.1 ribosomal protein S3 [Cyrtomium fortunei]YP_010889702.1 ribosomal protein S3 [Cyrtomium macrophyllum]AKF33849.1 ribosomal protein S3 [Cyrtomium falcatum]ALN96627.1 ribosomal protein S3 [Cyrtomium devexiscapulae]AVW86017.1 ribosomal protein S3 [Cyrtomium fortunei]WJJ69549.1 ribosomal protein S3 [Cyrtomium macrophyllum]